MWGVQCIVGHWPTCQLLLLLQIPLIPDREGERERDQMRHIEGWGSDRGERWTDNQTDIQLALGKVTK